MEKLPIQRGNLGKELEMKKKYPKLFLDSGLRLKFQR
jgi:hypothetical protein